MKTMLVIPDFNYAEKGWESERSYLEGFSQRALEHNWRVLDIRQKFSLQEIDCVLAFNYATYLDERHGVDIADSILKLKVPKILALFEAPTRRPDLWAESERFDTCISFNRIPEQDCRCTHIHCPYPYNFTECDYIYLDWDKRKSLAWIASNNWFKGTDSLSERRLQDFAFFAQHLAGEVALYGNGWDNHASNLASNVKVPIIRQFIEKGNQKAFQTVAEYWLGPLMDNKRVEASQYRYCFSYENTDNFPGYVTEKVFDAWMSGCVPVYLGEHEFETKYADLMISPRKLGKRGALQAMLEMNTVQAGAIATKFRDLLDRGEFKEYSHEVFQAKIIDAAEKLS